jgi:hypothetical protein
MCLTIRSHGHGRHLQAKLFNCARSHLEMYAVVMAIWPLTLLVGLLGAWVQTLALGLLISLQKLSYPKNWPFAEC